MLSGQLCDHCRQPFKPFELDDVFCDGCEGEFHRDCGQYELIERKGNKYAYFFCKDCMST